MPKHGFALIFKEAILSRKIIAENFLKWRDFEADKHRKIVEEKALAEDIDKHHQSIYGSSPQWDSD